MLKRHRQLQVKDLPNVRMWWLEWDSNPRPFGRKATNLPMSHHAPPYVFMCIFITLYYYIVGKDGISVHEAWINSGAPFLCVPSGKPMMPLADRIHPNLGQCSNKIRSVAYAKERITLFYSEINRSILFCCLNYARIYVSVFVHIMNELCCFRHRKTLITRILAVQKYVFIRNFRCHV